MHLRDHTAELGDRWWSVGAEVGDNLGQTNTIVADADDWLRRVLGGGVLPAPTVDEVALLAPNREQALKLAHQLVTHEGYVLFNAATDDVHTEPFGTRYAVNYLFLTTPAGYRLEVMWMPNTARDFSPLHAAHGTVDFWENPESGKFPIVHVSFKLPDGAAYSEVVGELAKVAQHGQTCRSTYGVFSYWLPYGTTHRVYVKPRFNERDAA